LKFRWDEKDWRYIDDVSNSVGAAMEYAEGLTEKQFLSDPRTQDAIVRRMEIIGEAARRLSDAFRSAHRKSPGTS
jgi:uncharacterized protein with HEPN domain